jgi:hypothetical protein
MVARAQQAIGKVYLIFSIVLNRNFKCNSEVENKEFGKNMKTITLFINGKIMFLSVIRKRAKLGNSS